MKSDLNEYYKSIKAPEEMRERALTMKRHPIGRILTAAASFFLVFALSLSAFGLTHAEIALPNADPAFLSVSQDERVLTFSVFSLGKTTLRASSGILICGEATGKEIVVSNFSNVGWGPERDETSFELSVSKGELVVDYTFCYAEGEWNIVKNF